METSRTHRALRTGAGLCLLLGLLGGWPVGSAGASCTGPLLGVGPAVDQTAAPRPVVVMGAHVTVSGRGLFSGCDDTGQGAGCGAPESEQVPLSDVDLVLEQGGRTTRLGTADASGPEQGYAVTWRTVVPPTATPGPAVLHAGDAELVVELRAER